MPRLARRVTTLCVALSAIVAAAVVFAGAQAPAFQPGQRVFAGSSGSEVAGIVVRQDQYGVLVRFPMWDGKDDPVNGPTRYYQPGEVRLATTAPTQPAGPGAPAPSAAPAAPGTPAPAVQGQRATPVAAAGPPLTQAEILGFLKARIGSDPWRHPNKPATIRDLSALIRARGADFRLETLSAFASELTNNGGNESTIPFHIRANYGPPAPENWLYGTWDLTKYARSTTREGNYRIERDTVAKNGQLRINPDHTYVWQSATGEFRGHWRPAVDSELIWRQVGGAGIVLERGKSGEDWMVHKWDPEPLAVDSISITLLNSESTREFGGRR